MPGLLAATDSTEEQIPPELSTSSITCQHIIPPRLHLQTAAAASQPSRSGKIPSPPSRGPDIPLQTFNHTVHRAHPSEPRLQYPSPPRSDSGGSAFSSLHDDTGDIGDQLSREEDPLHVHSDDNEDDADGKGPGWAHKGRFNRRGKRGRQKKVRIDVGEEIITLGKEEIEIPNPPPRNITAADRALVYIMTGGKGSSGAMRGLVGQPLLYFTSVFVSLGVFLFGYDQGVMSGIITGPYFKDYFNQPTRAQIGTMVAILEIGALISSIMVGKIGDIIGRRRTILYGALIFITGGFLQAFAQSMIMMILGRIIAGLGVGALSTIVPVYQSEISPPHNRGKLACIEFTGNVMGYCFSVWVDYFCGYINSDYSWRLPLLMQCVMGGLLAVGSLIIPESPRWLLDHDHDEQGIVNIANLYGGGDIQSLRARDEYREIKLDVFLQRAEGERTYSEMFRRYKRRVFIAMSAQALAQLNGINVISYYAPLVFESAGWVGHDAILMTGINGITYVLATIPTWYLVDRWGRRNILMSGALVMAISLSLISYFIYLNIPWTPRLVVIFVMLYNAFFGYSWGPIPWLYPPEILPLSIRAKGASLSTATNWAFNWLVGELTPVLQEWVKWRLYLIHAFFCVVSFFIVFFLYPETAGVRLEDMDQIFGDATRAMPTPVTSSERQPLTGGQISGLNSSHGVIGSPISALDIRQGVNDDSIPELDINPPEVLVENGRPILSRRTSRNSEGVGGWITKMVKRNKPDEEGDYKKLGQKDEEGSGDQGGGGLPGYTDEINERER